MHFWLFILSFKMLYLLKLNMLHVCIRIITKPMHFWCKIYTPFKILRVNYIMFHFSQNMANTCISDAKCTHLLKYSGWTILCFTFLNTLLTLAYLMQNIFCGSSGWPDWKGHVCSLNPQGERDLNVSLVFNQNIWPTAMNPSDAYFVKCL